MTSMEALADFTTYRSTAQPDSLEESSSPIWSHVATWAALLPALFIAVNGQLRPESAPVAFRFTAMEEDSLDRKLVRLGCSLLMLLLATPRLRWIFQRFSQAKAVWALCGCALISAGWSQNPGHTIVNATNLAITTVFAVYIADRFPGEMLLSFLVLISTACLFISLLVIAALPSVGLDPFQDFAWRGIFGQKNNCAIVCSLFLVIGLHYRAESIWKKLLQCFVISASALLIVMSQSRGGWALALVGVILTCGVRVAMRLRSKEQVLFGMGILVLGALGAVAAVEYMDQIFALLDKDPTMSQRTIIWSTVIPPIFKHPFLGYGYAAFWNGLSGESMQAILTTGWMEAQAQDGFLDLLLQLGLLGFVVFAAFVLQSLRYSVRALNCRDRSPEMCLAIVLIPIILLANIAESSILLPLGLPWFLALVAFLVLGNRTSISESI